MIDNFIIDLVVTENCNLKCKYCYEEHRDINMTEENFDHFYSVTLPQLRKLYDFNTYSLHFFGGEPLLNFKLIKYIVPILKKDRMCIDCSIVTNGLLINEEIQKFVMDNCINYSVSFDGLGNKFNRVDINEESTYDIYKNNEVLRKHLTGVHLTIDPNTATMLDEILIDLVENWGMTGIDFSLVRDDIWSDKDIKAFKEANDRLADKWIEYIKKGIPLTRSWFTLVLKDVIQYKKTKYKRPYCCFAGYNGVAVMPSGDVYPCARFGSERNKPIIKNDIIDNDMYEFFKSDELDQTKNKKCLNCYLYNYCNAGCKYSQIENKFLPLESVCKLNKIIFNSAIKIHNELKDNSLWLKSLDYTQN